MHKFLEHTADAFLEAKAKTFPNAIKDAMEGTFELIGKGKKEEAEFEISASSDELPRLVVKLLERLVVECELKKISPVRAEILGADEGKKKVRAKIYGERKVPTNIIKAVTYHLLEVKREKGYWAIRVLFDI
ncbi:MAG: archease [Candidatus ainarchaeum sp.]|nr:archease [Candidatus ainarchaeum sp.]MDD5095902.1 archease [Candidatus ainarchaeum sp.]